MRRIIVGMGLLAGALAASCSKLDAPTAADGKALYAAECATCHGADGEGAAGPSLRDLGARYAQASLATRIDETMPLGDPDRCDRRCAEAIAAYVLATFKGAIVCSGPPALPRGLRLLTRREYAATVRDLLGAGAGQPPCGTTTFAYDPGARALKSVHVAGSFNGWPQTIAAGGWPLVKQQNLWTLTRQVPAGQHQYKLVLDESEWVADPKNPNQAPDGFGGQNSLLSVTCPATGASGVDAALDGVLSALPPDTRPEGFLFDDHAASRLVSAELADAYVRGAVALAGAADVAPLIGCDAAKDAPGCAAATARALLGRAFRRPATDAEAARYAKVILAGADFTKGVRAALASALASPGFLYRAELGEKQADGTYRLGAWEVASALSYGLWGAPPDAELAAAAQKGALSTPAEIEAQAARMLASPRAKDTIGAFAEQWLGAETVAGVDKSPALYPGFDAPLRASMLAETRMAVERAFFDGGRNVRELFVADGTFVDARLAAHYGIPNVTGTDLVWAKYPDGARAGVLGHGSVLATTGHSDQTSPIRRGLFVRKRLLCQDFPQPPPNAGGLPKVDPNATTRERFAQHTANPACRSCHQYIDGVGFGFERFDTVGRLRDSDNGKPIDALGDMNDVEGLGTNTHAPFSSLSELGQTLAESDAAKACVAKQYWRFVRGRSDDGACSLASVKARFLQSGGDLRELVLGVVASHDFTVRR